MNLQNVVLFTTTLLALIATPIAGLLGMLIAWLVVSKLKRTSGLMDFVGMLGLSVPGTVIGSVYIDANDNRAADPGELGIGGVTVTLTGFDDLGNAQIAKRFRRSLDRSFGSLFPRLGARPDKFDHLVDALSHCTLST